jgi:hypothetical protein
MPAPVNNCNHLTTGKRSQRDFSIGSLPRQFGVIVRHLRRMRRMLEDACYAVHGAIGPEEHSLINCAVRAEQSALVCQRELRLKAATLKPDEVRALTREVHMASEARHRHVRALKLKVAGDPLGTMPIFPAITQEQTQ